MKDLLIRDYEIDKSVTKLFSINRKINDINISMGEYHVLLNESTGKHDVFEFGNKMPKTSDLIKFKYNKGFVLKKNAQHIDGEYKYNCLKTNDDYYVIYSLKYKINNPLKVCENINLGKGSKELIKNTVIQYIKKVLERNIKFDVYEYDLCKDVIDNSFRVISFESLNEQIENYGILIDKCEINVTGSKAFKEESQMRFNNKRSVRILENEVITKDEMSGLEVEKNKIENIVKKSREIEGVKVENEIDRKRIEERVKVLASVEQYIDDPKKLALLNEEFYNKVQAADSNDIAKRVEIEKAKLEINKQKLDIILKMREEGLDDYEIESLTKQVFGLDDTSSDNHLSGNSRETKRLTNESKEEVEERKNKYKGKFGKREND
ncbi:hypothetical protein [Oceanirhabdus seepicola]|uniref:Uncharacterized protein n=1 Tax=Oceanirhabdus seepicola TaxID=2828781 RepID=A0A9J6PAW5_9CLOT|nr:hypothetical protein [Oceanirhabdus seepicola]MCM1992793.1 hypothetical protein [Oceanirhabdus seepicola]